MDDSLRLPFSPPPRRKPDRTSFNLRRRALRRWLEYLPVADPITTGQLLLAALIEVNRLKLAPRLRWRFLEMLRQPVADAVAAQGRIFYARGFPLSDRNQELAQGIERMLVELGSGYCSLISEAASNKRRWRAWPLQRSLHVAGCLLLHYASIYSPPPPGLWAQLHRLFAQAERWKISHLVLPDPLAQGRQRTIAATYKHSLLLAAAGPYQMRPQVLAATYAVTEHWASAAALRPLHAGASAQGALIIDMAADGPPARPSSANTLGALLYQLDTAAIVALAQRQLRPSPKWQFWRRPAKPAADPALLRQLAEAFGQPPLRQSVRLPVQAAAEVFIGLAQVHHGLIDYYQLAHLKTDPHRSQFSGRGIAHESGLGDDDIWSLIYPAELLRRAPKSEPSTLSSSTPSRMTQGQTWVLLNSSAGGHCLQSDLKQSSRVQVGDPLVLRERGQQLAAWQLGVVRWIQHQARGLQIGVRTLGFMPMPALIRLLQPQGGYGPPIRALLLTTDTIRDRPTSLLTPPLAVAPHQRAMLSGAAGNHEILLSRLLESSNGFMRFDYQVANPIAARLDGARAISVT